MKKRIHVVHDSYLNLPQGSWAHTYFCDLQNIFRYHDYYKTHEGYMLIAVMVPVLYLGRNTGHRLEQIHVTKELHFSGLPLQEEHFIPKTSVFWDITPCIPLKVNQRYGGTCGFHLQGRRISQARNHREAGSKQTFNGLHGVISQKIDLFITTALRTSNSPHFLFTTFLRLAVRDKERETGRRLAVLYMD
jgi:hypothetical protein